MIGSRAQSPALFGAALVFTLAACADAPPPTAPPRPQPKPLRCPGDHRDPAAEVERWVPVAADTSEPPARRAEAVEQLACLAAATKASDARVILGVMSLGMSEIALHGTDLLRDSVVPEAKSDVVLDTLVHAFCDAADEIHDAARRGAQAQKPRVAAALLARGLTCSAERRALVAIDDLEERAAKAMWISELGVNWMGYALFASALQKGTQSARDPVADRAKASLARLARLVDGRVAEMAASSNPHALEVSAIEVQYPELLPALLRAEPAFEARLADPKREIRVAAGRTLETIWSASAAPVAPPSPDPSSGTKLQGILAKLGSGAIDPARSVELVQELLRLARLGRGAEPALASIRACLSLPADDVKTTAAIALAFVGEDRASLAALRATYRPELATSPSAFGPLGTDVALAILYLEPDDVAARRALGFSDRPLLLLVKKMVSEGNDYAWLVRLLQSKAR